MGGRIWDKRGSKVEKSGIQVNRTGIVFVVQ